MDVLDFLITTNLFIEKLRNGIPAEMLNALPAILFVLLSQAGLYVFTRMNVSWRHAGNEVTGIFFSAISLIYSLVLTFAIVAVWEDYEDLEQTIESEAGRLNSIVSHSSRLPDSTRYHITNAVFAYCNQVMKNEWQMKRHQKLEQHSAIHDMRLLLLKVKARNEAEQTVFSVIDTDLSTISDLRRSRLNHNRSHVPDLVWLILKIGSVMLVVFSFFFEVPSLVLKRVYLFFLSASIAMCMFLVYTLDHPFTGSARVSTRPYQNVVAELKQTYVINK